jgi:hypothetical protein
MAFNAGETGVDSFNNLALLLGARRDLNIVIDDLMDAGSYLSENLLGFFQPTITSPQWIYSMRL